MPTQRQRRRQIRPLSRAAGRAARVAGRTGRLQRERERHLCLSRAHSRQQPTRGSITAACCCCCDGQPANSACRGQSWSPARRQRLISLKRHRLRLRLRLRRRQLAAAILAGWLASARVDLGKSSSSSASYSVQCKGNSGQATAARGQLVGGATSDD